MFVYLFVCLFVCFYWKLIFYLALCFFRLRLPTDKSWLPCSRQAFLHYISNSTVWKVKYNKHKLYVKIFREGAVADVKHLNILYVQILLTSGILSRDFLFLDSLKWSGIKKQWKFGIGNNIKMDFNALPLCYFPI